VTVTLPVVAAGAVPGSLGRPLCGRHGDATGPDAHLRGRSRHCLSLTPAALPFASNFTPEALRVADGRQAARCIGEL
jgi:hypothetical protein